MAPCLHEFCSGCLAELLSKSHKTCPLCRTNIEGNFARTQNTAVVVDIVDTESEGHRSLPRRNVYIDEPSNPESGLTREEAIQNINRDFEIFFLILLILACPIGLILGHNTNVSKIALSSSFTTRPYILKVDSFGYRRSTKTTTTTRTPFVDFWTSAKTNRETVKRKHWLCGLDFKTLYLVDEVTLCNSQSHKSSPFKKHFSSYRMIVHQKVLERFKAYCCPH